LIVSSFCISLFLNTSIRRSQNKNVTSKYRQIDVRHDFPGERRKYVGEKMKNFCVGG